MGMMQPIDTGRLVITPNPVILDGQQNLPSDLIPGESLYAFLARHVDLVQRWEVSVDGEVVPEDAWTSYRPRHGQVIEVRGAVGKSVLRVVALIALIYFTQGDGATWASSLGLSGSAASAAYGAAFVAGSVIINKALGPKPPSLTDAGKQPDPTFSLNSQRNTFRPHEPVPLLFGKPKITPDLSSDQPYTFNRDNDQYLALILNCGINVDRVDALYNGDALLSSFEDTSVYYDGFGGMSNTGIYLYSNTDVVAGGTLDEPAGTYIERTSSADAVRLEIDLEYRLYDITDKGKPKWNQEGITAQYRAVGSGTWLDFDTATIRGTEPKIQRKTLWKDVSAGQYEVRVKRDNTATLTGNAECEVTWTALRSVQLDTGNYKGLSRIGVTCKASGQLNGSLDELRCIAYSADLEYWDGDEWKTDDTHISNPGAQILKYARGFYDDDDVLIAGMGLDDEDIDLDAIKAFILHCQANGYSYDYYLKEPRNHSDVLNAIALAGFGHITWAGGKLSVVWAADDQPLGGVVNMATIKRGQFQVDYTFAGGADGVEFTYLDASDWKNKVLRVNAPGVTTALNPARIAGEGITTETVAAKMARYHLAQHIFQYRSAQFGTDLEHLSYRRMSVLALSHDLTQWGKSGRVMAAEEISGGYIQLTLDEPVPAPDEDTPYIGLRIPGETTYRVFEVASFSEATNVITLVDEWPVDAALPGDASDNPAHDTIYIYDFKATPGLRCRVVDIQPESDMKGATVSVVPEDDAFWTYVETGTYIPSTPGEGIVSRPVASNLQATESTIVQGDTTFGQINVTFDISGRMDHAIILAQYTDFDGNTDGVVHKVAETRTTEASFRSAGPGVYDIIVRPFSVDGIAGGVATLEFESQIVTVPQWDNFDIVEVVGGLRRYVWSYDSSTLIPPDITGCQIRYIAGLSGETVPEWDSMTPLAGDGLFPAPFESTIPDAGEYTFAYRATTTSGAQSLMTVFEKTFTDTFADIGQDTQDALDRADEALELANSIIGAGAWDAETTYAINTYVIHNGTIYQSKSNGNLNHEPPNSTWWTQIGQIAALLKAHAASISTNTADISTLNGITTAQGTALTAVQAAIDDPETGLSANATAVELLDVRVEANEDAVLLFEASWTVTLDVNGYVSGVQSINDGTTSSFQVLADTFEVINASAGNYLLWKNNVLTARGSTNSVKIGPGFGADSTKLIFYYGPNIADASAEFEDALVAINAAGKAKLAGTNTNLASGWSSGGAITSSYNSSSPATVTINVAAGTFKASGVSISYSASSNTVSQTRGTTVTYYLHYIDAAMVGGAKTLQISTGTSGLYDNPDNVVVGTVAVEVPASGSGSGGGNAPSCPSVEAFVQSLRGIIRAGDVVVGDWLRLDDGAWGQVSHSSPVLAPCVRVQTVSGHVLTCSESAPLGTAEGRVLASHALGVFLRTDTGLSECIAVEPVESALVQHITCCDAFYLAGDVPDRLMAHHNKIWIPP